MQEDISNALVEAAQRGDIAAQREVVKRSMPLVTRMVSRAAPRSAAEREDLQQECVLIIYRAIEKYRVLRPQGRFLGYLPLWLRAVLIRRRYGANQPGRRVADFEVSMETPLGDGDDATLGDLLMTAEKTPEDNAMSAEHRRVLLKRVERLSWTDQLIFRHRVVQGMTLHEIAAIFGCSRQCIQFRCAKIEAKLQKEPSDAEPVRRVRASRSRRRAPKSLEGSAPEAVQVDEERADDSPSSSYAIAS